MNRAIATVSLSGTLEDKLAAVARAGFDGVELFENDLIASPLTPAQVRARCADLGLDVVLYQPLRDFEAVPPAQLERNLWRAERKFDVMEELGADLMLVCSNVSEAAIDDDALAAEQLHTLADRAHARGMRIAYEALAWGRHVDDYEHAWRIVERADHPALGTCLDSFHILSRGSDPAAIRDIPGEKLFFLQLADAPHLVMDVLQWSRHYRCFPGQGGFDLATFTGHVLAAGYTGPLSLEVFNDVFRQADPDRMAVDALRSLLVLEERLGTLDLPAPTALGGYAFVELGVPEPDAAAVTEDVLAALGFTRVGPHRSKPVQLWEHGDVRVVLNHGADEGVAAIAVESADPDAAAARAERLLAPVLERRRGPGEADLSAIAAPDDTEVLFTGADWLRDFVPLERNGRFSRAVPQLTGIDHVALSQPFDFYDEAALFYRSVLGLEPRASTELASPDGLVRSRAMTSAGVRLVLNVPALGNATHGQTAAVQHVAFACRDVLGAVREMRERGLPALDVPGNYYDDLAARLDVDADLLAELRELGVLYDRTADGRGELLHAYTAMVGGRLFFELVERRGTYDGYGAVNSPVRMAAQRAARPLTGVA